ncbi:MAG: aryl sulfotransferase, partial [candidate division Zixibacteria bacterium]|nr:aryl sulfotransferase [candidate division Zixibacteria bacterium]
MSFARTTIKGLVFCDSRRAYRGLTLFTPVEGKGVWLIDMFGGIVNQWEMAYEPGCYGELLPNGNLLYAGRLDNGPLTDIEGAGGILLEVDWDGKTVWEYKHEYLHHAFYRMKNGNTLVLKWVEVPKET